MINKKRSLDGRVLYSVKKSCGCLLTWVQNQASVDFCPSHKVDESHLTQAEMMNLLKKAFTP